MTDFTVMYETEKPRITGFLLARGAPVDAVDDLVSETFLSAWRGWALYEDRGYPVSTWLRLIARSRLIDHRRYHGRRPVEPLRDEAVCGFEDRVNDGLTAQQEIVALLHTLTPSQSRVIWLRYACDQDWQTIATRINRSVGAAKVLLARAHAALGRVADPPIQHPCSLCSDPAGRNGLCRYHYKQQWQRAQRKSERESGDRAA